MESGKFTNKTSIAKKFKECCVRYADSYHNVGVILWYFPQCGKYNLHFPHCGNQYFEIQYKSPFMVKNGF